MKLITIIRSMVASACRTPAVTNLLVWLKKHFAIQRQAQLSNELSESEVRLRDIIFSMGDWVWEVDEKGVYTYSSSKGR